jgi:hypothetical protein
MANCPDGHPNPAHYEFCGECGAPIDTAAEESETDKWYRTKWAIVGAGVLAVLVIVGAAVTLAVTEGSDRSSSSASTTDGSAAIQQWWSGAHQHFTELQNALDDSQRALDRLDSAGLEAACQRMHDAAGVDLQAHLPTPDPDLTSELAAATADAHAAAHMCLSLAAGSANSYGGEFAADVDQADKHLTAAQELINKALTHAM